MFTSSAMYISLILLSFPDDTGKIKAHFRVSLSKQEWNQADTQGQF